MCVDPRDEYMDRMYLVEGTISFLIQSNILQ